MAIDFEKKAQQFERFRAQESANTQEDAKWLRQLAAEVLRDMSDELACTTSMSKGQCREYIRRRASEIEGGE